MRDPFHNKGNRHPRRETSEGWAWRLCRMADSVVSRLVVFLGVMSIMYSGYVLYDMLYTQNKALAAPWEVLQYRPGIIDDDAATDMGSQEKIQEINDDYRAWLTVYDTHIDYPVMQGENDLYYSSHDIYRDSTLTGSIYLSAVNSPDFGDHYNLLYGHHMDNGAMFGDLGKFLDRSFLSSHRRGMLVTSGGVAYDLTFFAALKAQPTNGIVYEPRGKLSVLVDYVREKAVTKDMSGIGDISQVIALSTCTDNETNGRLIVFATMAPRELPVTADPATRPQGVTDSPEERKPDLVTTGVMLAEVDAMGGHWAIVNLVILAVIAYVPLPLMRVKAKYGIGSSGGNARHHARRLGERGAGTRFWVGIALETALLVVAIVMFVMTEDITQPLVVIDWWTLPMLTLLVTSIVIDMVCVGAKPGRND